MFIAFPPCTHLAVSGAKHFEKKRADGRQQSAIKFFTDLWNLSRELVPKVCFENPIGIMSGIIGRPTQIIQPWYFGDSYQKTTCLWLQGLPPLFHAAAPDLFNTDVTHVDPGEFVTLSSGAKLPKWYSEAKVSDKAATSKARSKTFPGIARAMAEQWG